MQNLCEITDDIIQFYENHDSHLTFKVIDIVPDIILMFDIKVTFFLFFIILKTKYIGESQKQGGNYTRQIHPWGQSSQAEMICPSWQMHWFIYLL